MSMDLTYIDQSLRSLIIRAQEWEKAAQTLCDEVNKMKEASEAPPPKPPEPEVVKVELKDLQRAAQKAYAAGKDKEIMKIMQAYEVKSLSRIHPDFYAEVVRLLNAL